MLVGSIMAERFLYLPSIAFAGALVWAALFLHRRVPGTWISLALAVACLALAGRTWARNADWVDDHALWTSAVQVCPDSYKAHQNLAMLALAQPQPDYATATREAERALAIVDQLPDDRNVPGVYATAGQCLRARGDRNRALAVLERGRRIDRAWNAAFQARNQLDGKTVPSVGTPPLHLELGRLYLDLGQPDKAIEALREGRLIDPQPAFFEEMARAYRAAGQTDQANVSLLEALVIYSGQSPIVAELTHLYRPAALDSCELTTAATGVTLNMNCPLVRSHLCSAAHNMAEMFTQMRDASSAAAIARSAQNYGCSQ